MTQLNIPDSEYMYSGHVGCPGCGAAIAMKEICIESPG